MAAYCLVQSSTKLSNNKMYQKSFVSKILVTTVVILAAVVGYLYLKNPVVITKIFQKELDETAGWKTYRNEEYRFEFKYPGFFGDIPNNISGAEVKSQRTDYFLLKIHRGPLDGFKYLDQPGGFSFTYNGRVDKWIADQDVEEIFAPVFYKIGDDLSAYLVKRGDGGSAYEIGYIQSPDKKFVVEINISRNVSWVDCVSPCPEDEPFSDNKTIESVLDSVEFY